MTGFPSNAEIEQAVVGAALVDGTFRRESVFLQAGHFFDPVLAQAWAKVQEIVARGETPDLLALSDTIDPVLLTRCVQLASGASLTHARMVRDNYDRRVLLRLSHSIAQDVGRARDPYLTRRQAQQTLADLHPYASTRVADLPATIASLTGDMDNQGRATMALPWRDMDWSIGGIAPDELVIIAARPGMGKTAMLCQLASFHERRGTHVLCHTLEGSARTFVKRLAIHRSGVNGMAFRRGAQTPADIAAVRDQYQRLASSTKLTIVEGVMHADDFHDIARQEHERQPIDLILVDYLQRYRMPGRTSLVEELGDATDTLKNIALELQCVVVVACQLRRLGAPRPPSLEDLRDSGRIEQTADIALGLYREDYYSGSADGSGEAKVSILKNREGNMSGEVILLWDAPHLTFSDRRVM